MIKRNLYLEEIKKYINKPIIKVITGMRRSGKSMILKLIQEELQNIGIVKENIIYMNFESLTFMDIKDFEELYKHIIEKTSNKKGKIYSRNYASLHYKRAFLYPRKRYFGWRSHP